VIVVNFKDLVTLPRRVRSVIQLFQADLSADHRVTDGHSRGFLVTQFNPLFWSKAIHWLRDLLKV
jgi:hypothetical protein